MKTTFVILFVLAVVSVIFAMQNPGVMEINFGPWTGSASMALIILATLMMGAIGGALAMVPARLRRRKQIRQLNKTISDLAASIAESKQQSAEPAPVESGAEAPLSHTLHRT